MLTIRLSRTGRKKSAFFRVVLTEHSKPVKAWYQEVLGWVNPIKHESHFDIDKIKEYVTQGSQISERVAKLLFKETKDTLFKKFFIERTSTSKPKSESK